MKTLKDLELDMLVCNVQAGEAKKRVEHLTIIHKYVSKAYSDIMNYGWSKWQHLIPTEIEWTNETAWACDIETKEIVIVELPEMVQLPEKSLEVWAMLHYHKIIRSLEAAEEEVNYWEMQHAEAHLLWHQLKTNQVQGAKRFEQIWNQSKQIEMGVQQAIKF